MPNLAIITARGGSKRIPRKNIKLFLGKPIMAYSIEAALAANCFEEIMVSTDDLEIAEIGKQFGAKVPFMRSPETANDYATTQDVIIEVLNEYKKSGKVFDKVCCIYPTAPFVQGELLQHAIAYMDEVNADTIMPVVPFSFPPQRAVAISEGKLSFVQPEHRYTRSQDLEKQYHDCGQFYCIRNSAFEEQKCLLMKRTYPLILNELQVQDIDNEVDWQLAELKYKLLQGVE